MVDFFHAFLYVISRNFGSLCAIALAVFACIAYWRGELGDFFLFLKDMLCGPDGRPSTKNAGYFMGAAILCWSFSKVTLAVCRRIDAPLSTFDPTMIFLGELGVIATLVGVAYLGGKYFMAKGKAALEGKEAEVSKDE
jgi:hypothetical protein